MIYSAMFVFGSQLIPMFILTLIWGIVAGISSNITQYIITSAAPDAPDLSNGIFLSAVNLGTTVGTFIGGVFISTLGSNYVLLVGILASILSIYLVTVRNQKYTASAESFTELQT